MAGRPPVEVSLRFWERVENRPNGCWEWTGPLNGRGQAHISFRGVSTPVARIAWLVQRGPVSEGRYVVRWCGNRRCVRASHLALANRAQSAVSLSGPDSRLGELNPNARLRASEARAILRRHARGASMAELAERYRVSRQTIWMLVSGRSWRNLERPP